MFLTKGRVIKIMLLTAGVLSLARNLATHHLNDADFGDRELRPPPAGKITFRQLTAEEALQTSQQIPTCKQWPRVPYRNVPIQEEFLDRRLTSINLGEKRQTYFGTLHAHTEASDGKGDPEIAYRFARDIAKLDFFAVTDHPEFWFLSNKDHYEHLKSVAESAWRPGFVPLFGFEYSNTVFGHYIVLNAEKPRTAFQDVTVDSFYEWLRAPEQKDALVAFAHPGFHDYRIDQEFQHFAFDPELKDLMFAIEVIHWRDYLKSFRGFFNQIPYVDEAARFGFHLGVLGSQDIHGGNWGLRDRTRVGVLLGELTKEKLLLALKKRHFFATSNHNLQFAVNLKLQNQAYAMMGDQVSFSQLPNGLLELTVRYFDPYCDEWPSRLEVIQDGHEVLRYDFQDPVPPLSPAFAGEFKVWLPRESKELPARYPLYVRFYQGKSHNTYPMTYTQSSPIYLEP